MTGQLGKDTTLLEYGFALIVEGLDFDDDGSMELLETVPEVMLVSSSEGAVSVDLAVDAASAEGAVRIGVHLIEDAIPACRVARIDLDLVSAADIADRIGVTRQAVSQWARGQRAGNPFPGSLGVVTRGTRIWSWAAVHPWLLANGHSSDAVVPLDMDAITHVNALLLRPRQPGHVPRVGDWQRPAVRATQEDLTFRVGGEPPRGRGAREAIVVPANFGLAA